MINHDVSQLVTEGAYHSFQPQKSVLSPDSFVSSHQNGGQNPISHSIPIYRSKMLTSQDHPSHRAVIQRLRCVLTALRSFFDEFMADRSRKIDCKIDGKWHIFCLKISSQIN